MLWGLIGAIIGILGIFVSWLGLKDRTLRYWQVEPESIFSKKIKEIKNLRIIYDDKEISDDVIIIKTIIENNGKQDIDNSIVHEPLKINFKEPIELLEVKTISSQGKVDIQKENNSIICKWDLLKRKEFIILKILLKNNESGTNDINNKKLLDDYTELSCRITDLSVPKKENYTKSLSKKIDRTDFIMSLFMVLIFVVAIVILLSIKTYKINYKGVLLNGNDYTITCKDENTLLLHSRNNRQVITIEDYKNTEKNITLKIVRDKTEEASLILFFTMLAFMLVRLLINIDEIRVDKKVRSFFENNK